jgi:hypothetical protein
MAAARDSAAKCWLFTLFYDGVSDDGVPRPTREEAVSLLEDLQDKTNYIIWGDEVAPTTGAKHFQCYCQFETKYRLSQVRKFIPRCNWKIADGTDEDNYIYCSKGGKFSEFGERRDTTGGRQGREAEKKRWKQAREAAVAGDLDDIDDQIFVQHYGSIKSISKDYLKMPADADGVTGVWIWGPPGVGKSRKARADFPGSYFKLANKWWDGYNPKIHKTVILDDLDKVHSVLCYHLKLWADRYAFLGETKGGALALRPEKMVVTSNYSIEEIFGPDESAVEAIRRRFKVIHMDEPFRATVSAPPLFVRASASTTALSLLQRTDTLAEVPRPATPFSQATTQLVATQAVVDLVSDEED